MPRLNTGVGAEHQTHARGDHLLKVVGENLLASRRVRRRRSAAWRQRARLGRGADRGDQRRRQRVFEERVVLADLGAVAEADDRRPVRLLLREDRQELVVHHFVLDHVDQHVGPGFHHGLLIGQRRRVRVDQHLVCVRLVDDSGVDVGRHLRVRAAAVVHPDLHAPDVFGRHPGDRRARLPGGRDLVDGVQRRSPFAQHGVGTAASRRHAGHEEEARRRRKLAGLLVLLKLERGVGRAAADRLRRAHAVERCALQMVQNVLRRVVGGAPARVALVADVHVDVDHRRHDALAGQIHACRTARRRHRAAPSDDGDPAVLDDECAVFDRRAAVADDQPGALEQHRAGGTGRLDGRGRRTQERGDDHARQHVQPTHAAPPYVVDALRGSRPSAARRGPRGTSLRRCPPPACSRPDR